MGGAIPRGSATPARHQGGELRCSVIANWRGHVDVAENGPFLGDSGLHIGLALMTQAPFEHMAAGPLSLRIRQPTDVLAVGRQSASDEEK